MELVAMTVGALTMLTLDGREVVMSNYGDRRGTVILFMSGRCPTTRDMIEVINDTYEATRYKEILFVGLCANDAEPSDELTTFCQRRAVRFPVYRDPGHAIADKLGVTVTPEALLLDPKGTVVYRGGLHSGEAAQAFASAIADLVAGKKPVQVDAEVKGTPIDQPGQPLDVDDPFGTVAFSSELIFERIPNAPVHHCSTLTEAPNGDLVCVWYGGSYESSDDQVLFVSRRKKGERAWSTPEVLVTGTLMHPPGNAVVFRIDSERMGLIWGRMDASRPIRRGGGWSQCQLMIRFSNDNGHTWTDDREMPGLFGCLPRNAPITLHDGAFAVPLSGKTAGRSGGFLLVTRDAGRTWQPSGVMPGGSQPTVIQRDDGSLLAFLRSFPNILRSESTDLGATWTIPEPTDFRCPGSGIAMCRLDNGHLVLVYNNSPTHDRTPLNIVRSTDEGATWDDLRILEPNWGEYSYPCVIQTSDGTIHVTYTFRRYAIKHVQLNEDWLAHLLRPN